MPVNPETGGGPWTFTPGALGPGEPYVLNLREIEWNGRPGYFRPWLPLSSISVTNSTADIPLELEVNNQFSAAIAPNTVETFDRVGITRVEITNLSDTGSTAEGDIQLELLRDPWDSDDKALAERQEPRGAKAIKQLLGGFI